MPVKRLPRDSELFAERADARVALAHTRHRDPQLRSGHLPLAPADAPARAGGGEAGARALGDELALELRERGEDAEDELAGGRRRVDRRALAGEYAQSDSAGGEVMHRVDQVAEIASEPIELPHHERVAFAKRLQARGEAWPLVLRSGSRVAVDVPLGDAGGDQGVALQVEHLRAVGFRDAHVADERRGLRLVTQTFV